MRSRASRACTTAVDALPEKHDALTRLAALLDRIINPPADNTASLDERHGEKAAM